MNDLCLRRAFDGAMEKIIRQVTEEEITGTLPDAIKDINGEHGEAFNMLVRVCDLMGVDGFTLQRTMNEVYWKYYDSDGNRIK